MAGRKGYLGLLFLILLNLLILSEARSLHHIRRQFPHIPKTNTKLHNTQKFSSLNRYYSTFANVIDPPEISTSNPAVCINPPVTPIAPTPLMDSPPLTPTSPSPLTPLMDSPPLTPTSPSPLTPLMESPPVTSTPPSPLNPLTPIQPLFSPPPKITQSPPKIIPISPPIFTPGPPIFLPPIIYPPPLAPPSPIAKQNLWCVAKPAVPDPIIQEAMDYACGSGADCKPIRSNGSCFEPDTVISHASFAFNSYWQDLKETGATCDFGGVAVLVTKDPSYDVCRFKFV